MRTLAEICFSLALAVLAATAAGMVLQIVDRLA